VLWQAVARQSVFLFGARGCGEGIRIF
jgi:hypothetical protein